MTQGARIRAFRRQANLTQAALADISHITQPRISQFENNERKSVPQQSAIIVVSAQQSHSVHVAQDYFRDIAPLTARLSDDAPLQQVDEFLDRKSDLFEDRAQHRLG